MERAALLELERELEALEERTAELRSRAEAIGVRAPIELDDEEREHLRIKFSLLPDAELVWTLLTLHKTVEQTAAGTSRRIAQIEATTIGVLLDRLAPEALNRGIAMFFGDEQPRTIDFSSLEDDDG